METEEDLEGLSLSCTN